MIFLKKFYAIATAAVLLTSVFSGCSSDDSESSGSKQQSTTSAESIPEIASAASTDIIAETTTVPASEVQSETARSAEKHEIKREEGVYVYDNARLLDSAASAECNEYAKSLYTSKLLNVAVVTADDLFGLSPDEYAANAYNDLYSGRGSGMLFLLNNASGDDILYLHGNAERYVSQEAKDEAYYWGTKEIVSGEYAKAAMRMLKLAEGCPQYVFDNAGLLEITKAQELEEAFASSDKSAALLITSNQTETKNEDLIKEYYSRRFSSEGGILIMIDTHSGTALAYSGDNEVPSEISEAVKKAADLSAAGDHMAAVNTIAEAL